MKKYCDAHCHFNFSDPQLSEFQCKTNQSINTFICNATCEDDWAQLVKITAGHKCMRACLGIHPWYVASAASGWDVRLAEILAENRDFMVGEIGLDKLHADFDAQCDIFIRQMEIARELQRTVQIHCVHAWDEMLRIFKIQKLPHAIVAHGFVGAPDLITQIGRNANVYFSYSDKILNSQNVKLRHSVYQTPINKILVESDATPNIAESVIPRIVAEIAKIKSVDDNEMADIIYNNTMEMIKNG